MQTKKVSISRRCMLKRSVAGATGFVIGHTFAPLFAAEGRRYKIGACDWSFGKGGDIAAFEIGREIGLDGVQVSMGSAANGMRLRKPELQTEYKAAAKKTGLEIASLAIGELNTSPYKSDPQTTSWVRDSIGVCRALGLNVVLLAFFGKNDLKGDKAGQDEVVRRLKAVAPKAEKAGVKLGIESWLSADEHLAILEQVGSPAVQVYYDCCNSNSQGYDIYAEIRKLGKLICEFHAKENGTLLGQGRVDYTRVRAALDEIGYRGWLQIEGALPPGKPILESYRANCAFLRKTFA
jgi:sugar phosphate isomerase/epimerase